MAKNPPVMITVLTDDWRALREWVTKDGQPDVVAMSELFGDAMVLVVDCDEEIDTDLKRREMPFREFARWWRSSATGKRASAGADARAKLYVKDWNFVRDFSAYRAYDTPPHVRDDWLNSSWSNEDDALCSSARGGDDDEESGTGRANENENEEEKDENDPDRLRPGSYRFVYCGVQGTWTPMHVDVARSFSWSVNVCGRKKWLMVPRAARASAHRDGSGVSSRTSAREARGGPRRLPRRARGAHRGGPASRRTPVRALVLGAPGAQRDGLPVHQPQLAQRLRFGGRRRTFGTSCGRFAPGFPIATTARTACCANSSWRARRGSTKCSSGRRGVWLQRLVRELELAGTESSSRGESSKKPKSSEAKERGWRTFSSLCDTWCTRRTSRGARRVRARVRRKTPRPKIRGRARVLPRAGTRGVGERVDVVVSVPSRESAAEETERRTRSDAFVESFDVDPEENVHRLAEIVDILRRAATRRTPTATTSHGRVASHRSEGIRAEYRISEL